MDGRGITAFIFLGELSRLSDVVRQVLQVAELLELEPRAPGLWPRPYPDTDTRPTKKKPVNIDEVAEYETQLESFVFSLGSNSLPADHSHFGVRFDGDFLENGMTSTFGLTYDIPLGWLHDERPEWIQALSIFYHTSRRLFIALEAVEVLGVDNVYNCRELWELDWARKRPWFNFTRGRKQRICQRLEDGIEVTEKQYLSGPEQRLAMTEEIEIEPNQLDWVINGGLRSPNAIILPWETD